MDSNLIVTQFERLKQHGMAEAVRELLMMPIQLRPSLENALVKIAESEVRHRDDAKTARLLKGAKLYCKPLMEDVICSTSRNLTRDTLESVADCGFVRRGENLVITARTGCGKTYLACAIGHQACRLGFRTLYLSMNHFVHQLKSALAQGEAEDFFEKLNKVDLLIFDDFGLQPLDEASRIALLTLLEDRYERKSVIITSQLAFDKWYDYIGQTTVADAILDRITHSSHLIRLEGESLRKRNRKL